MSEINVIAMVISNVEPSGEIPPSKMMYKQPVVNKSKPLLTSCFVI
jgi:hypothetical protein